MTVSESYSVLGLDEGASMSEVKSSFRSKAMDCHPDQANSISQSDAKKRFIQLKKAYDKIRNIDNSEDLKNSSTKVDKEKKKQRYSEDINKNEKRDEEWQEFKEDPESFLSIAKTFISELISFTFKGFIVSFPILTACMFTIYTTTEASAKYVSISSSEVVVTGIFIALIFSIPFSFLFPAISYIFANLTTSAFFDPISAFYLGEPYKDNYRYRRYFAYSILSFIFFVWISFAIFSAYRYITYEPIQL